MSIPDKVRSFLLEKPRQAVVATLNADGSIHQTVMWFDLEGDEVVLNTKRGRVKETNLRARPALSVCVEDGFRYATLSGTVHLDEDPARSLSDISRLARRYVSGEQLGQMLAMFAAEPRLSMWLRVEKTQSQGL